MGCRLNFYQGVVVLVCGIDFESTGLDTNKDRITEIGAVIFDTKDWTPLKEFNCLVWEPSYPKLIPEVVAITGITQEMLEKEGKTPKEAILSLGEFTNDVEVFVAHNAPFDQAMLLSELKRHGYSSKKKWVCSARDLKSNKQFKSWRLAHLALDYGVTVNPKLLHRAVDDVKLMGVMLKEAKADINAMIKYMETPDVIIAAMIPKPWEDGGKGKDAAKELGYSWQQPKGMEKTFQNRWVKVIKEDEFDEEQRKAKFKIEQLKGE